MITVGVTVGSLCSGYGGLDLAVEHVFHAHTMWLSENDAAASRVLDSRWPGVPNYGDLTALDWATLEPVDILTAGYPCQPFSQAGQRKGTDDARHLWPHIAEAVRRTRPRWVVLENVPGHRSLGFDQVLGDLAAVGYDARWASVRASDVGAPHRRERLFAVAADAGGEAVRLRAGLREGEPGGVGGRRLDDDAAPAAADAERGGRDGRAPQPQRGSEGGVATAWGGYQPAIRRWERVTGRAAPDPTEPNTRGGRRLNPRFVEWMMGLPDGWVTDVPDLSRNDQLKILGNGVVPQQAVAALRWMLGDVGCGRG